VAPWAAPKELVVVAELPRTASGKVRRTDLD
jgi:acyl-coenzyme A synthetase/AMP-(fatty) acid ligase